MRRVCQNFDREDGLETVPEIPIPEEMLASVHIKHGRSRLNMKTWIGSHVSKQTATSSINIGGNSPELQLLMGVVGAPLVPIPFCTEHSLDPNIKEQPIESLMAKYIVQQYVAATGGEKVLNSINSMYAIGKVVMSASEMHSTGSDHHEYNNKTKTIMFPKVKRAEEGEVGRFVLWQKRPDLWCIELVMSGSKISAGSDGKVAWRQTPWHQSHASKGPPRPLRRSLQGLDPRSTANLFSNAVCNIDDAEKTINNEACFPLKLEADPSTLKKRSGTNVEIVRHTVWGYFSQRTGLLVQLEDTHLLRIKQASDSTDSLYWETTMSSTIGNYRLVDGVNIAHSGKTIVSLFRFGDNNSDMSHARTFMEETWTIEEVDFNIWGLSADCFLPPADLKKLGKLHNEKSTRRNNIIPAARLPPASTKIGSRRVVKIAMQTTPDSIAEEAEEDEL